MQFGKPKELLEGEDASNWLHYARLKLRQLSDTTAKAGMTTLNRVFTPDGGDTRIRIIIGPNGAKTIHITSSGGRLAWSYMTGTGTYTFGYLTKNIKFKTVAVEPHNPPITSTAYDSTRTHISQWNNDYLWMAQTATTADSVWVGRIPDYQKGGFFTFSGRALGFAYVYAAPDNNSVIVSRDQGVLGGLFEYYSYVISPETHKDPVTGVETITLNEVGSLLLDESGVDGLPMIVNLTGGLGDSATGGFASTDADFSYLVMSTIALNAPTNTTRTPISYSVNTSTGHKVSYEGDEETIDYRADGSGPPYADTFIANCMTLADGANAPWMLVETRRVAYTGGDNWKSTTTRMWSKVALYRGSTKIMSVGGSGTDPRYTITSDDLSTHSVLTKAGVDILAFSYRTLAITPSATTFTGESVYDVGDEVSSTFVVVVDNDIVYTNTRADPFSPIIHPTGTAVLVSVYSPTAESFVLEKVDAEWVEKDVIDKTDGTAVFFIQEMPYSTEGKFKWLEESSSYPNKFYEATLAKNSDGDWEYSRKVLGGPLPSGASFASMAVFHTRSAYMLND